MKFYRKIVKNHEILLKNHEKSWNFMKKWWKIINFFRRIIQPRIAGLDRFTIYLSQKIKANHQISWKIRGKKSSFFIRFPYIFGEKTILFFRFRDVYFFGLPYSFREKSTQKMMIFLPELLACWLAGLLAGWLRVF